jgi:hypothetical protein
MNNNDDHSLMLSRIAAYVEDFAETENDSTLLCVLRLLVAYHELKQAELYRAIEREEGEI